MAQFAYVARDPNGGVVRGTLVAANPTEAAKILRNDGKFPVRVNVASASDFAASSSGAPSVPRIRGRFRPDDVVYFVSQLRVMCETGVSLAEALASCKNPKNSPAFEQALDDVISKVEGGDRFSA